MKKGQTLVISFISIIIILLVFIPFFYNEYMKETMQDENLKLVEQEAGRVASILSDDANPRYWVNITQVNKIGLTREGIIHDRFLSQYPTLRYPRSKLMLGITYDYLFFFLNDTAPVNVEGYEYFGWNGVGTGEYNGGADIDEVLSIILSESVNLGKDERFVQMNIANKSITAKMVVYVWDDRRMTIINSVPPEFNPVSYDFDVMIHTDKLIYEKNEDVGFSK